MSEKTKYPHADALLVAKHLVALLAPDSTRIQIAGSLRRCKPMVGDIEILYVPKIQLRADGFFDVKPFDVTAHAIENLVASGEIEKRLNAAGSFTWGALNKLARHVASGIKVDFFSEPDVRDWPRSLAVRTGPKEFNVKLMATAPRVGLTAHAYGEALHKIPTGQRVIARDEREFIELCGLPWEEPENRI